MLGSIHLDIMAAGQGRDVDELSPRTVGAWPKIVAALDRRADLLERLSGREIADASIRLNVFGGVVFDRSAGFLIDALGPVDLHIGLRADHLPIVAVQRIEMAVAGRVGDQFAWLSLNIAVDQNVGSNLVIVP